MLVLTEIYLVPGSWTVFFTPVQRSPLLKSDYK